ncbi:MAG: PAS domain S-box protein, partial [Nanoarchaeota archaeon]|nr:PAS domain S-box protein [Nanoarchaeota archaeon]
MPAKKRSKRRKRGVASSKKRAKTEAEERSVKQAEEALKESEEKYRTLVEGAPIGIVMIDAKGKILFVNQQMDKWFRHGIAKVLGKPFYKFGFIFTLDSIKRMISEFRKGLKTLKAPPPFEVTGIAKDGTRLHLLLHAIPVFKGKTPVAIQVIFVDVGELKKAEREKVESETKFRQIFNFSPISIVLLDTKGKVVDTNKRLYDWLGYKPEEAIGKHLLRLPFLTKKSKMIGMKNLAKRLLGHDIPPYDVVFLTRKGEERIGRITATLVRDENGKVTGDLVMITDITEEKNAEDALKDSEEKYRSLVENANEVILIAQDRKLKYVNPKAEEIIGYTPEQLKSKSFVDFIHPDDRRMVMGRYIRRLMGFKVPSVYAFRVIHKNGTVKWCQISAVAIKWGGRPATLNFMTDITERKEAEDALKDSEQRYKSIFESSPEAIGLLDTKGKLIDFNENVFKIVGYRREEMIGKNILSLPFMTREGKLKAIKLLYKRLKGEDIPPYELEFRHKDGSKIIGLVHATPLKDAKGKVVADLTLITDITKFKETENALRESEERYANIIRQTGSLIYDYDVISGDIFWGGTIEQLSGFPPKEFASVNIKKWAQMIHPDDRKEAIRLLDEARKKKKPYVAEYRFRKKDGSYFYARDRGSYLYDKKGKPYRMLGLVMDITAEKTAQRALQESELKYRTLTENALDGVLIIDFKGKVLFANQALADMLGFRSPEEGIGLNTLNFILPDSRLKVMKDLVLVSKGKGSILNEYHIKTKDGREIWMEGLGTKIIYSGKDADLVSLRDVTERRKVEGAVKESEEKYRTLTESILEGIIILDFKGTLLFGNKRALDMFGFKSMKDVAGKNVMQFIAPESRTQAAKDLVAVWRGKEGFLREYKVITNDGRTIWVDSLGRKITYQGKDADLVAIRDVTESRKAEEALKVSEERYRSMFENILAGFAYHELIVDKRGRPVDYRFLEVNSLFEKMTGLKREDILGKTVTQVLPGTEKDPADWIGKYGDVALTGKGARFEQYAASLGKWFHVSAYSPKKGYFVTLFEDITDRKKAEDDLKMKTEELERFNKLAVGRELRMIELKKKMAEFEKKSPEKEKRPV